MGTESAYQLGTRVTVSDYLYRVEARGYYYEEQRGRRALDLLAEYWPQALDRSGGIPAKIWIPASVHRLIFDEHGIYLRCDTRRHPTPSRYSLNLPVAGIVCGKVTLQDGTPDYDESGSSWTSARRYTGYRVAYHLSRRPLTVLPSMIQPNPTLAPAGVSAATASRGGPIGPAGAPIPTTSEPTCDTCHRLLSCVGTCPKGCEQ